jgi:hypothetical protein
MLACAMDLSFNKVNVKCIKLVRVIKLSSYIYTYTEFVRCRTHRYLCDAIDPRADSGQYGEESSL